MNRREFLKKSIYTAGVATIGGRVLYDTIREAKDKYFEDRIYNELSSHVYNVEVSGNVGKNNIFQKRTGKGIVKNNRLLTCAHIIDIGNTQIRTPFGMMSVNQEVKNLEVKLNGSILDKVYCNFENDIAVYTNRSPLPSRPMKSDNVFFMNEPDFPCKPSSDRKLGDEVYVIGNPLLQGVNIRKGRISDLDGTKGSELTKHCFGTNIPTIPGDSGTPCVSKDFKLLGINNLSFANVLGYTLKIEEFFK